MRISLGASVSMVEACASLLAGKGKGSIEATNSDEWVGLIILPISWLLLDYLDRKGKALQLGYHLLLNHARQRRC